MLPSGDRAALARRLVVSLWVVLLLLIALRAALWPTRNSVYPIYSHAGQRWVAGENLYDDHFLLVGLDQYRYSPTVTTFFVPLSLLPDAAGGVLWRLLNIVVFFGGAILFLRDLSPGRERLSNATVACLGLLLVPEALPSLNNGQANPLMIGCVLLAVAAALRERWNLATLALVVAILLKIYPLAVALLLLLLYPRQLGWRLALALALALAVPFAFQSPSYVADQYGQWFRYLHEEDRRTRIITESYRDFFMLTRWLGHPMPYRPYLLLQLGTAAGIAGVVLWGRWRAWPRPRLLARLVDLGCCWMLLLGPATENCTYIVIAPTFAAAAAEGWLGRRPLWTRGLLTVIVCLVVANALITAAPGGRDWVYPLQPLACLLLFAERVLSLARRPSAGPAEDERPVASARAA